MPSHPPSLFTLKRIQWPYQSKIVGAGPGGAAESATKDQDVTMTDILKTGDWSQETTFTRYYYGAGSR